ncbi:hypothetical protein L484_024599 [Morus notabilis]|uniref:Uncharacterized protein n=1 Tax=Morus notabilis TaxID=981085 RepID=W9QRL2_9ROSA|nr:hypothetical protein L484_024599 [Morus notabilis]
MVVIPPITTTHLQNLQSLNGLYICEKTLSGMEKCLKNLTTLRELGLCGQLYTHQEHLEKWIFNSKDLECLKLTATRKFNLVTTAAIPQWDFSGLTHLYKLHLSGFMSKMFDIECFPTNLTELSLTGSLLMEDPMEKLEKF